MKKINKQNFKSNKSNSYSLKKDFNTKSVKNNGKPQFKQGVDKTDSLYLKGRHEVIQALESQQSLSAVYISLGVKGAIVSKIKELASNLSIPVKELNSDIFEKKFGEKTQGIAAEASEFEYTDFNELIKLAENGKHIIVALNQVEDARNLGAIVRTVEAMGCDGVVIPKHRSAGMTEWAIRTAQGAASWLPVSRVNNLSDALDELKENGYWIAGLDGDSEKQLTDVYYNDKIVLVAGGEDAGLGERVKKECDDIVKIPMSGKTTSLNVSVSVAMALYEILRQRNFFYKLEK